jgi:hypothetical protein
MNILIGFEESGTVCAALRKAGHNAVSCDLVPTRGNPAWHIQGDIIDVLNSYPDNSLDLIILHPVCTAMALSGNKHYGKGMPKHAERIEAIEFTVGVWELAKRKGKAVALENPKSVIFPILKKLGAIVQYVQPYQFGHMEQKSTGFALHNLSKLQETNNVYEAMMRLPKSERERVFYMSPGKNRQRDRSATYQGIADAIADQWAKPGYHRLQNQTITT